MLDKQQILQTLGLDSFTSMQEENAGSVKVGKVNVDEQMALAQQFQVSSIPMLLVIKNGNYLHTKT